MPRVDHQHPGGEVQEDVAVHVLQPHPLPPGPDHRHLVGHGAGLELLGEGQQPARLGPRQLRHQARSLQGGGYGHRTAPRAGDLVVAGPGAATRRAMSRHYRKRAPAGRDDLRRRRESAPAAGPTPWASPAAPSSSARRGPSSPPTSGAGPRGRGRPTWPAPAPWSSRPRPSCSAGAAPSAWTPPPGWCAGSRSAAAASPSPGRRPHRPRRRPLRPGRGELQRPPRPGGRLRRLRGGPPWGLRRASSKGASGPAPAAPWASASAWPGPCAGGKGTAVPAASISARPVSPWGPWWPSTPWATSTSPTRGASSPAPACRTARLAGPAPGATSRTRRPPPDPRRRPARRPRTSTPPSAWSPRTPPSTRSRPSGWPGWRRTAWPAPCAPPTPRWTATPSSSSPPAAAPSPSRCAPFALSAIGDAAAEAVARAIVRAVRAATPLPDLPAAGPDARRPARPAPGA